MYLAWSAPLIATSSDSYALAKPMVQTFVLEPFVQLPANSNAEAYTNQAANGKRNHTIITSDSIHSTAAHAAYNATVAATAGTAAVRSFGFSLFMGCPSFSCARVTPRD